MDAEQFSIIEHQRHEIERLRAELTQTRAACAAEVLTARTQAHAECGPLRNRNTQLLAAVAELKHAVGCASTIVDAAFNAANDDGAHLPADTLSTAKDDIDRYVRRAESHLEDATEADPNPFAEAPPAPARR